VAYTTQERIQARIPAAILNDALDDDKDGAIDEDVLAEILQAASDAVDAMIGMTVTVPMTDPPAAVTESAFCFACEMIYDRRQVTEKNPYRPQADAWRKTLGLVAEGKLSLSATTGPEIGIDRKHRKFKHCQQEGL
jgi:phage gp36-like protein